MFGKSRRWTSSGQRSNEGGDLLCGFPLSELAKALLPGPHRRVDDFEEELARTRIEDENSAIDGLGGEVALERLVDGDAINVGVVHEPYDLVRKELAVVLRGEIRFRRLRRVQL
eukprot:scaffold29471_cov28-Tisochrysis_lutea.AAC.3